MDSYLPFWDNHIVEVKFNWQPSTEQIAKAAEALCQQ